MTPSSTSRSQRNQAAQKAAEVRREAALREQRRRNLTVTGVVLVVLAVIVGIGYSVQSGRDTTGQSATAPSGATAEYGVPLGSADAPVTVTIYEDFLCPVCGELEAEVAPWLRQYVAEGKARVEYRPLAFLNRYSSGTEYSTRAVNAYAAVLHVAGPEAAGTFHDLLFEHQPEEGSTGLSDDQLVDLAVEAGAAEGEVGPLIEDGQFEQWSDNATDQASKQDVTGTPTVEVDGERFGPMAIPDLAQALRSAVDAAQN